MSEREARAYRKSLSGSNRKVRHAAAERLRLLGKRADVIEPAIRNFERSDNFQKYRPRNPKDLKALRSVQPKELQGLRLPYVYVRTGVRGNRRNTVPNAITRVRRTKSGFIFDTDAGRRFIYLDLSASTFISNPGRALATVNAAVRAIRKRGNTPLLQIRVGFSVMNRSFGSVRALEAEVRALFSRYPGGAHDARQFFEGFVIQERRRA